MLTHRLTRNAVHLARTGSFASTRTFTSTPANMTKIVAVLYDGGKAAQEEPRLLGTTENKLGMEQWAKENGHE